MPLEITFTFGSAFNGVEGVGGRNPSAIRNNFYIWQCFQWGRGVGGGTLSAIRNNFYIWQYFQWGRGGTPVPLEITFTFGSAFNGVGG